MIFGTSITEYVDGDLMSRGIRTVVNVSSSGANIDDIRQMAEDFHHENLPSIHKIDKIIVSVGTNDVKFYNPRIRNMSKDLKPKLISLVKVLKQLFHNSRGETSRAETIDSQLARLSQLHHCIVKHVQNRL